MAHHVDRETVERVLRLVLAEGRCDQWANIDPEFDRIGHREGLLPQGFRLQDDATLAGQAVEYVWEMLRTGVLRPKPGSGGGLVWFVPTEFGRAVLATDKPGPYDPAGFLAGVRRAIPDIDDATVLYLEEAVSCFRQHNHIAAVVMMGVAAESALVLLAESMVDWLGAKEGGRLRNELDGRRQASRLIDEVQKRLDGRAKVGCTRVSLDT